MSCSTAKGRLDATSPFVRLISFCLTLLPLSAGASPIVTDDLGRRVFLTPPPRHIISLAPSVTEIPFAVGDGGKISGDTIYCDFPPSSRTLPHVGGPITPSVERTLALRPDLIIYGRPDPVPCPGGALGSAGLCHLGGDPRPGRESRRAFHAAHALASARLASAVRPYFIAAQRSPEPGHAVLLESLGLTPLFDLGLRLGAAFALPLVRLAAAVLRDVATFDPAGVTDKEEMIE